MSRTVTPLPSRCAAMPMSAQLALHEVEFVAVPHRSAVGEFGPERIFVVFVGDDDDRPDPFGGELTGYDRYGQAAIERLAPGHRHRVVEEDLVGHVDVGGDR